MQWQIVIELAGGIAEAIHRGECPSAGGVAVRDTQLPHCDLKAARAVLSDLRRLTGRRHEDKCSPNVLELVAGALGSRRSLGVGPDGRQADRGQTC